jgi:transposase
MWLRKKARRVARRINDELRRAYMVDMAGILAEQMVFFDKSMFNEITEWRLTAWAPIGEAARYIGDMNRDHIWSLLAVYTTQGYLPCVVIKEGYFNTETFLEWLKKRLLFHYNAYPGLNSVIVLDNASVYCDQRIANAIRAKGCLVRFLPPYSPEYSLIELSFSVLKAWVRRRF